MVFTVRQLQTTNLNAKSMALVKNLFISSIVGSIKIVYFYLIQAKMYI